MSSPDPAPVDPILDPLMRNRPTVGAVFAALALLFLVGAGWCFTKAYSDAPTVTKPAEDKSKPTLGDDAPAPEAKLARPHSSEYTLGGIVGLVCALAAGGWLLGRTPSPDPIEDRRNHRLLLFSVGAALGVAFMVLGFALFYLWFGELSKWLGQSEKAEPLKPLLAVLAFLLGAGLLFAGVQPLRAEERHDPLLRRIVYGTNFFLTALLLVVGLVFVNVLATLKLPSKLDTTESGFYTLSEPTRDYLGRLDKDVVVYSTIQEAREGIDALRVLNAFQEANPRHVKLKPLSLTLDKSEIAALKTKFPAADIVDSEGSIRLGVVVALGPDEKRYQFIHQSELFGRETAAPQGPARRTLQAEPRLIREILFLTEDKRKPVVYFTQGAGEVAVESPAPDARSPSARPGLQLKNALLADYCDVKTLNSDPLAVDPRVPDDATVVVVADPVTTLGPGTVAALRKYMTTPKPDGTKGKLLVMAGAHSQPGQGRILTLGIEDLLAEFGVAPRDRVLYGQKTEELPPHLLFVSMSPELIRQKNTLAMAFFRTSWAVGLARPIEVDTKSSRYKAAPLLLTFEERVKWVEPGLVANPDRAFEDILNAAKAGRKDIVAAKEASGRDWPVAAISSEADGSTGRAVVYGFGGFEDREQAGEDGRLIHAELITASVNWLRDRPAVANEGAKPYGVYTPNPKFDWTRGFTLPVALVVLSLAAVGLGLWVLRRR